ncbi:MAG: hypothetical protein O9972_10195 [Burkholderiales bacterium]|nr:hypothetical protein [Burkholderiales bacterium]
MLPELLLSAITPASRQLRRMGLVTASVGLWSRNFRQSAQWKPHYARCHAVVRRAVEGLPSRRTVAVLGSGLAKDIPMRDLLAAFGRVVLVDAVHLPTVRLRYALDRQVSFLTLDLSGMAGWLAGGTAGRVAPLGPLAADPALDLVISANLLSQIPIGVATFLEDHPARAAALPADILTRSVQGHLDDLATFRCRVCLLTDTAMTERDRTGAVTDTLDLMRGVPLPRPDEAWDWTVAPFGEVDRTHEYVHRVQAYAQWDAARRGGP